jgi:hypothetical protein
VVLWLVAGLGLLVALVALWSVRRLSRRLDALTQSYWELRYDYTRLRSRVTRLDPDEAEGGAEEDARQPSVPAPSVSFVPLSSIKRKTE